MITKEQTAKAGRMIKVMRLACSPGMDEIAIKLNCGLTLSEAREALLWSLAFDVAAIDDISLFQAAAELKERYKIQATYVHEDL